MIKVSVCILAKNEEKNLAGCINSIKDIADEIIVVDNGSTDRTAEIAKSYGCRVLDGADLELDKCRDIYLQEATCDWILIIDADERFEELEKGALKEYLDSIELTTWGIEVLNFQHLGHGKWSEIFVLRLIRNNKKIKYNTSPIHASMSSSILNQGAEIKYSNNFVLHHLDILIKGRTELKRKRYRELLEDCIHNYKKYNIDEDMLGLYKCFLGLEYVAIGNCSQAEQIYKSVMDNSFRYQNFAIQSLCQLYIYTNNFKQLERYMEYNYLDLLTDNDVLGNYLAFVDREKAIEYYKEILQSKNARPSAYVNYAYLVSEKNVNEAKHTLNQLFSKYPFLRHKELYNTGEKPNIFDVQSNILYCISDLGNFYRQLNVMD